MTPRHIALAVLVAAIWGFNFVVISVGLESFPPLLLSALRFSLAALPMVFFVGWPRIAWRWVLAVGLVLGVVKFTLLFVGMDVGMSAGLSSLVLQSQAFFTVLLAMMLLKEKPRRQQIAGMVIAFSGMGLIAGSIQTGSSLAGFVLVIAAAAAWGVSNILTKQAAPTDMLRFMVWVSIVPPLPLFLMSWIFEGGDAISAAITGMTLTGVASVFYLAFGATILGFALWGFLIRTYSASLVAPFSLLVPVFGMSFSALLLGETFGPLKLLGAGLVILGLFLTVYQRRIPVTVPAS